MGSPDVFTVWNIPSLLMSEILLRSWHEIDAGLTFLEKTPDSGHPPTHPPLKLTIPYAGVLDVKGRHRSWQMQPRTWKSNQLTNTVRKTNPSNPSSGEAKRTVSDRTFFQI
jgi:hypothetical protein